MSNLNENEHIIVDANSRRKNTTKAKTTSRNKEVLNDYIERSNAAKSALKNKSTSRKRSRRAVADFESESRRRYSRKRYQVVDEQILEANTIVKSKETTNLVSKPTTSLENGNVSKKSSKSSKIIFGVVITLIVAAITVLGFYIVNNNQKNNLITDDDIKLINQNFDQIILQIRTENSKEVKKTPIEMNDVVKVSVRALYDNVDYDKKASTTTLLLNPISNIPNEVINDLLNKKAGDTVRTKTKVENQSFTQIDFTIKILEVYKLAEITDKMVQNFVKQVDPNSLGEKETQNLLSVKNVDEFRELFVRVSKEQLQASREAEQKQKNTQEKK